MSEQRRGCNRLEDLAQHLEEPARPPLEPPCIAHQLSYVHAAFITAYSGEREGLGSVTILVLLSKCPPRTGTSLSLLTAQTHRSSLLSTCLLLVQDLSGRR